MWTLLLVTAMNVAPAHAGNFPTQETCQTAAKEWQVQGVKSGCVPAPSPEEAIKQAQIMMQYFLNSLEK
jgi:hypothetical protein